MAHQREREREMTCLTVLFDFVMFMSSCDFSLFDVVDDDDYKCTLVTTHGM